MNAIDWIGYIGVVQILLAYALNAFGILHRKKLPYILLNIIGAGMACLSAILMDYIPFIILEGAWTFVSIISLIKYFRPN